jgi:hypothetical protein
MSIDPECVAAVVDGRLLGSWGTRSRVDPAALDEYSCARRAIGVLGGVARLRRCAG